MSLNVKTEHLQIGALVAIGGLTLALCGLNVGGAWHASHGNVAYTVAIACAEIMAAVALSLVVAAPGRIRKAVGAVIFALIVWVCIENGKMSVEASFSDVFVGDSESLLKKAELANSDAGMADTTAVDDRRAVSEEIATLKVERDLMTSSTRIRDAQLSLKSQGLYIGPIDGIRAKLTEDAMLQRGEAITRRLAILVERQESGASPATDKRLEAIDLEAAAKEVTERTVWMVMLLMALEGCRSAGVWAFIAWNQKATIRVNPEVFKDLQDQADELARRKANLETGAEKAVRTKTKKKKVQLAIEHQKADIAKREEVLRATEAELDQAEAETVETDEPGDGELDDDGDENGDEGVSGSEDEDEGGGRAAA